MIYKINYEHSSTYKKKFEIIREISTEKPTKKGKNFGNIFFFLNFYGNYKQEWKSNCSDKNTSSKIDQILKKLININKLDLRDLCLKRGKILRKIKIKMFLESNLDFNDVRFSCKYSLGLSKKELNPTARHQNSAKYLEINETVTLKGFLKKLWFPMSISRVLSKNSRVSQDYKNSIIVFNYKDIVQKKVLSVTSGSIENTLNNFKIILKLLNSDNLKKKHFYRIE